MLDEKLLNKFIKEIEHVYQQFCVWKHTNNQMTIHEAIFNAKVDRHWCDTSEAFIAQNRQFQNFWTVTVPSLQHGWMISVSRLMDNASYGAKKNIRLNLSMKFIIQSLEDPTFSHQISSEIEKHKLFIENITDFRNKYLAHNDIHFSQTIISKGFEDYIECLLKCVDLIKASKPNLRDCLVIDLDHIEKASKAGVDELFTKISV